MKQSPTGGNFIICWNIKKTLNVNLLQKYKKHRICVANKNLERSDCYYINLRMWLILIKDVFMQFS